MLALCFAFVWKCKDNVIARENEGTERDLFPHFLFRNG